MSCDPACVKVIIDTGMGAEAARLYEGVMRSTGGVSEFDIKVGLFYAQVTDNVTKPAAQALNALKMGAEQRTAFDAQINKQCYRALDFRNWAGQTDAQRVSRAASWTGKILAWLDEDQAFYTGLAAELGSKKKD